MQAFYIKNTKTDTTMTKQSDNSINWVQRIRQNWTSYFRDVQPEDFPYALLATAINRSLLNGSSIIKVSLGKDGSITVKDNSKVFATRFENLLTIRGDDNAAGHPRTVRRILDGQWYPAYPLINALSKETEIRFVWGKNQANAKCSRGEIIWQESHADPHSRKGLTIRFLPDSDIQNVTISAQCVEEILWGCAVRFSTVSFYLNGRIIG